MNNYLDSPRKIQFELSSTCNLLCLGCVRTDPDTFTESKSFIDRKTYLSKETFLKIIQAPEFDSVTHLEFCGTIDDPLMHPEFLELLESALKVKQYVINIHTNASLRNITFWKKYTTGVNNVANRSVVIGSFNYFLEWQSKINIYQNTALGNTYEILPLQINDIYQSNYFTTEQK